MTPYHYTAFGLHITSESPCPELWPGDEDPDIQIRYGAVRQALKNPDARGCCIRQNPVDS